MPERDDTVVGEGKGLLVAEASGEGHEAAGGVDVGVVVGEKGLQLAQRAREVARSLRQRSHLGARAAVAHGRGHERRRAFERDHRFGAGTDGRERLPSGHLHGIAAGVLRRERLRGRHAPAARDLDAAGRLQRLPDGRISFRQHRVEVALEVGRAPARCPAERGVRVGAVGGTRSMVVAAGPCCLAIRLTTSDASK